MLQRFNFVNFSKDSYRRWEHAFSQKAKARGKSQAPAAWGEVAARKEAGIQRREREIKSAADRCSKGDVFTLDPLRIGALDQDYVVMPDDKEF